MTEAGAKPEEAGASGQRPTGGLFGRVTCYYANRKRQRKSSRLQALELSVTVLGHPTVALVDSGATHCFVSHTFA